MFSTLTFAWRDGKLEAKDVAAVGRAATLHLTHNHLVRGKPEDVYLAIKTRSFVVLLADILKEQLPEPKVQCSSCCDGPRGCTCSCFAYLIYCTARLMFDGCIASVSVSDV